MEAYSMTGRPDDALKMQVLFQTLGDANRLRILRTIGAGERPVNEIVSATGLSQPLVSHHLRVLRDQQVLETRRRGPFVFYAVKDKRLLDALGIFRELALAVENPRSENPMFCCPPWWRRFSR
jgi:DNA-binding transcriptional ArsR family regulator